MIAGLIARFVAPYALQIAIGLAVGLAVAGGLTAVYFKIRHDAVVEERIKVEREKQDAINKANKAREILRDHCVADPKTCVPEEYFRD